MSEYCPECEEEIEDQRYYRRHGCFNCGDDPHEALREGIKNNLRKRGLLNE